MGHGRLGQLTQGMLCMRKLQQPGHIYIYIILKIIYIHIRRPLVGELVTAALLDEWGLFFVGFKKQREALAP